MTTCGGDSPESEGPPLALDTVLEILSHHHRRDLFRLFREESTKVVDFERCVSHLVERERERTGQIPGPDHLRITLHHVHLPKLSHAGLVTYDESAETLRYHRDEGIEEWLGLIESEGDGE
ncbi:hypothetical protein SAMN04488063_1734 [Halopelagius inordinatus]|uniref:DUF7344 domain-containing protein n=1 Tax=Halopelagius inordinatus TaxID=553467 RepID=A0A1I2R7W4_9EURY|nr:hypothetical protein [Halopelagius inordinatus]SFG33991.1 hypothetical protein SAMN04488063_1734 [Halopelagius inordinatus]